MKKAREMLTEKKQEEKQPEKGGKEVVRSRVSGVSGPGKIGTLNA